jgi:aspartyl/asparaginyl beta-hydroxylase (cupin superfamily)
MVDRTLQSWQQFAALTRRFPAAGLERIKGLLEVWSGQRQPDCQPLQRARRGLFLPGLATTPWLEPARFGFVPAVEQAFPALRSELLAAAASGSMLSAYGTINGRYPVPLDQPAGWRELPLVSDGRRLDDNCRRMPETARLVDLILAEGRVIQQLTYSVLEPGTRIAEHTDPMNYFVSVHIGIVVPPGCGLKVADEARAPTEGRCFAFDNSFVHSAWNEGGAARVVLAIHTLHPGLTALEKRVLAFLATGHDEG